MYDRKTCLKRSTCKYQRFRHETETSTNGKPNLCYNDPTQILSSSLITTKSNDNRIDMCVYFVVIIR